MKKHIFVVGAVIVSEGLVLCAQRGPVGQLPGLWEFPGGKIEADETPQDALVREIREELLCSIAVLDHITETCHEYDFARIHLATYYCRVIQGEPRATEHSELRWVVPADLLALEWAPADIPALHAVIEDLTA